MSLGTYTPNLKSKALTTLELLAFKPKKWGLHDPVHGTFRKICKGHVRTLPGNIHVKFIQVDTVAQNIDNKRNFQYTSGHQKQTICTEIY